MSLDREKWRELAQEYLTEALWAYYMGHWFEHDRYVNRVLRFVEASHSWNDGLAERKEKQAKGQVEVYATDEDFRGEYGG